MRTDLRWWFAALCLFWGGTWLAVKVGVSQSPPLLVACVRAIVSGLAMTAIAGVADVGHVLRVGRGRIVLVALLCVTVSFAAVFWGTARLSTGVSAIANNATMPIGLLLFGCLLREETASRRQVLGIALGVVGLALLFARRTDGRFDAEAIAGLAVVVVGALAYCLGSVLARPLLRTAAPMAVGGTQMLLGGIALLPVVALVERPGADELLSLVTPPSLMGMTWMVLAGGVGATFIYLRLVRDWGPARAGMYAFVTPIIATVLGVVFLQERLGLLEVAGAALLLSGAALVIASTATRAAGAASASQARC